MEKAYSDFGKSPGHPEYAVYRTPSFSDSRPLNIVMMDKRFPGSRIEVQNIMGAVRKRVNYCAQVSATSSICFCPVLKATLRFAAITMVQSPSGPSSTGVKLQEVLGGLSPGLTLRVSFRPSVLAGATPVEVQLVHTTRTNEVQKIFCDDANTRSVSLFFCRQKTGSIPRHTQAILEASCRTSIDYSHNNSKGASLVLPSHIFP